MAIRLLYLVLSSIHCMSSAISGLSIIVLHTSSVLISAAACVGDPICYLVQLIN